MSGIGTYRESSLHRSLKFRYADSGKTEISIGGYVCDGLSDDGELIEVQTGSFGPLKNKIKALSQDKKVRIIYPVVVNKYIELYDTEGNLLYRRKSPLKGCIWDVFGALLYAPELCTASNVTIELSLLDIAEKRVNDGKGPWRRRGVTLGDKVPIAWHESIIIKKPYDYNIFVPFDRGISFSVKDLSEKAKIKQPLARKCLYVLNKAGLIEKTGKNGKAILYKKKAQKINRILIFNKDLTRKQERTFIAITPHSHIL